MSKPHGFANLRAIDLAEAKVSSSKLFLMQLFAASCIILLLIEELFFLVDFCNEDVVVEDDDSGINDGGQLMCLHALLVHPSSFPILTLILTQGELILPKRW
mmetsp:Transcript_17883/g.36822  ORF Transcript_17883/g.36822 Transcript_17883/m.36822 type:complete len:102 (-) Transcript_17883:153-458(-)